MAPQMVQGVYRTGFCNDGLHEGTQPVTASGKGRKVCTLVKVCQCECHKELDAMFAAAEMERVVQQNPKYEPYQQTYVMPTGEELQAQRVERRPPVQRDLDQPYEERAGRGQLEHFAHRVCMEWFNDPERNEDMTTARVGELIQEITGTETRPSSGAVHSIFVRWQKCGWATIGAKPVRFCGPTPEGLVQGLDKMRKKVLT